MSRTCRTCLFKENEAIVTFYSLDFIDLKCSKSVKEMLTVCVPELALDIVSNSVLCSSCANSLESLYEFKTKCLQTERTITSYLQQIPNSSCINLNEISEALLKSNATYSVDNVALSSKTDCKKSESTFEEIHELQSTIKTEELDFDCKDDLNTGYMSNSEGEDTSYDDSKDVKPDLGFHSVFMQISDAQSKCQSDASNLDGENNENDLANLSEILSFRPDFANNPDIDETCSTGFELGEETDENKKYECETCGKIFGTRYNLYRHVKIHVGFKSCKCEICDMTFYDNGALNKHMVSHSSQKLHKCLSCDKSFARNSDVRRHMKTHTGERPYNCPTCGKSFGQKGHLQEHMRYHSGETPFVCELCNKSFPRKTDVTRHMKSHSDVKPHVCEFCEKCYKDRRQLLIHMEIHTLGERQHKCETCGKSFGQRGHLLEHVRYHTGETPFSCEICLKSFPRKTDLTRHMKSHSDLKPHICELCHKSYKERRQLLIHMKTHTGQKDYICEVCAKSFITKPLLKRHMQIHTGLKPYCCDMCEFSCTQKNNLLYHMKSHGIETLFQCDYCDKEFVTHTYLNAHKKIHAGMKFSKSSDDEYLHYPETSLEEGTNNLDVSDCDVQDFGEYKSERFEHTTIDSTSKDSSTESCEDQSVNLEANCKSVSNNKLKQLSAAESEPVCVSNSESFI